MKIQLQQVKGTLFEAISETGQKAYSHSPLLDGEPKEAMSPMEHLLVGVAGCTAVDVVLILSKMKEEPSNIEISIEGIRQPIKEAKPFREIYLEYSFHGNVSKSKAERAVKLAVEKYCSVIESLHQDTKIHFSCVFF